MQVSMAEAAERLNVSIDTIRRRLHKGELKGTREPTAQGYRWKIDLADPGSDPSNTPADARTDATVSALMDVIDALKTQLSTKDQQIDQLHHLMAQTALNEAPVRPWWKLW